MTANKKTASNSSIFGGVSKAVVLKVVLPILIIAAGAAVLFILIKTKPEAKKKDPKPTKALVHIEPLKLTDKHVSIYATGTVVPAREVVLMARVSGEITRINPKFVPGGVILKGDNETILSIDATDYEIAKALRKAELTRAEYELELEEGQQKIAQEEYEQMHLEMSDGEKRLALRKPHLENAKASVRAAEASLRRACLDIERTKITVPFNAIIRSKDVDLGTQVTPQTPLGSLVCTDEYWVRVMLPSEDIRWIKFPQDGDDTGAATRIMLRAGRDETMEWSGRVYRLQGDLEEQGRLAQMLVSVKDPLGLKEPEQPQMSLLERIVRIARAQILTSAKKPERPRMPLLLGSFVNVEIEAKELKGVFEIPRSALHDGNTVWIMKDDDTLEKRKVSICWRDKGFVLVREGLKEGERLVVNDIASPVAGMRLRISGDKKDGAAK